jgi:aspartyl-tRNA synthetase
MTLIAYRTLPALEPLWNSIFAPPSRSITLGDVQVTEEPHFLWVTEFPLFTHDDSDKEFLAHGRWSSSHHPFTAPMWQDIDALYGGDIESVRSVLTP